jgi:protein O-mannosyl-transferase
MQIPPNPMIPQDHSRGGWPFPVRQFSSTGSMKPPTSIQPAKTTLGEAPAGFPQLLSPRGLFLAALGAAAVVFAVYLPSLNFQFILDNHRFTADPRIQSSGYLWDYFANYVWAQFTGGLPSFYRPLFVIWMRINFIVCALSPWGWHLLSIAKHLAVAGLLGLLVWKLLRDRAAALLASTLFALHPAQTESVAWVTVPDPLMSIGVLASLLLFLDYIGHSQKSAAAPERGSRKKAPKKNSPSPILLIASACACLMALLAKETAIITPVIIFAVAWADRGHAATSGKARHQGEESDLDFRHRFSRAIRQTLPFLIGTGFYLLLRLNALGRLSSRTQDLPLATVLLSWPATLWFYVKVLLWPTRSRAFADPSLVEKFSYDSVLLPMLGVLFFSAALAGMLFWMRSKARLSGHDSRRVGIENALIIGTLLLVLPILLALDLPALNPGDFLHGRYTYLSLAGLMLLGATAWHMSGRLRVPLLVAAGLLAVAFSALTFSQQKLWSDDLTVFTRAHELAPHNAPVARNLADAHVQHALGLADQGQCDEAVPVFQEVNREYPEDWYAWAGLGECLVQLDKYPQAEESFHKAADLSHDRHVIEQWQLLREHMGLPASGPNTK